MKEIINPPSDIIYDKDGYLINPLSWSEIIAENIAYGDGIAPLTELHWNILVYLRENYLEKDQLPDSFLMSHDNFIEEKHFIKLFKYQWEAWKIAGLANPNRHP